MNPALALVAKDIGQALVNASRKPIAKWMRKRARKLRDKRDEKTDIDISGRA